MTNKTAADKIVTVRKTTLGDGKTKLCIPVTARGKETLKQQAEAAASASCDIVEWRADFWQEGTGEDNSCDWIRQGLELLRDCIGERALLFTFRTKEEGGERSVSAELYQKINETAARSGLADLIDLEYNRGEEIFLRLCRSLHACGTLVLGSFHDFFETPDREALTGMLCRMQELGADVTKAAVMPRSEQDVLTLLAASIDMKTALAKRPYVTMAMGSLGSVSRIAGALTGSAFTFATAGHASAPGQMDAAFVRCALDALQNGK